MDMCVERQVPRVFTNTQLERQLPNAFEETICGKAKAW